MKKPKHKQSKVSKKIPSFRNEEAERKFWAAHDSADYIDWSKAAVNPPPPQLKPSAKAVSIRLPEWLLAELKQIANKQDIPYQSLIKTYLVDRVKRER